MLVSEQDGHIPSMQEPRQRRLVYDSEILSAGPTTLSPDALDEEDGEPPGLENITRGEQRAREHVGQWVGVLDYALAWDRIERRLRR